VQRPVGITPHQSVLLARRADDPLRVLIDHRAIVPLDGIFMLCRRVPMARLDGIEFVPADAAIENLGAPRRGIEPPPAPLLDDWNGHRPVLRPHDQGGDPRIRGIAQDTGLHPGLLRKIAGVVPVLHRVVSDHEVLAIGPEHRHHRCDVELPGGEDQRLARFLGRLESRLLDCRGRWHRERGLRGAQHRRQQKAARHRDAGAEARRSATDA
jgi:hypothetical protein